MMLPGEMLTFSELSPLLLTFEIRVLDVILPAGCCLLLARALRFWNQFLTFFSAIWPYWLSSTATSFTLCLLRVPLPCWNKFSRICSCCWLGVHFDLDALLRVRELILRTISYKPNLIPCDEVSNKGDDALRLRLNLQIKDMMLKEKPRNYALLVPSAFENDPRNLSFHQETWLLVIIYKLKLSIHFELDCQFRWHS